MPKGGHKPDVLSLLSRNTKEGSIHRPNFVMVTASITMIINSSSTKGNTNRDKSKGKVYLSSKTVQLLMGLLRQASFMDQLR